MATKTTKIWYVDFPTYQYNEDVQELAKASGARILDARFDDGTGSELPKLTLKNSGKSKVIETPKADETIYDVYKVVDGEQAKRVSRANLTKAEAEIWIKGRDDDYTLVISD